MIDVMDRAIRELRRELLSGDKQVGDLPARILKEFERSGSCSCSLEFSDPWDLCRLCAHTGNRITACLRALATCGSSAAREIFPAVDGEVWPGVTWDYTDQLSLKNWVADVWLCVSWNPDLCVLLTTLAAASAAHSVCWLCRCSGASCGDAMALLATEDWIACPCSAHWQRWARIKVAWRPTSEWLPECPIDRKDIREGEGVPRAIKFHQNTAWEKLELAAEIVGEGAVIIQTQKRMIEWLHSELLRML